MKALFIYLNIPHTQDHTLTHLNLEILLGTQCPTMQYCVALCEMPL